MLVVSPLIFVAEAKLIYDYNFVVPSNICILDIEHVNIFLLESLTVVLFRL